ncbi:MAG: hypothetical protein IJ429_06355 [Lachnospiraceae bacterium]|nr:hypothetical protein [Lachnospiraceae bacterium]
MNLLIFASFTIFGFWLTITLRKSRILNEKAESDFWENESMANSVRKKQLEESDFVVFPFDKLPTEESFSPNPVPECLTHLLSLTDKKMVNLNGISNTEVKKRFGAANMTILSEYDANYELFVKNIYLLCQHLYDIGRKDEALMLSEETILTGTDSLSHYKLIIQIYQEQGNNAGIDWLRQKAESLHSITKAAILRALS